jgi:hypothetical protein
MDSREQNVQVPADVWRSLIETVEDLRKSNTILSTELNQLKENSGARFHRFSKLPTEVRRMIWKFALTTPQTHIFNKILSTRSNVNCVMDTCKEALQFGMELKLPFFQTEEVDNPDDAMKHYMNLQEDTVWLTEGEWPGNIHVKCPICAESVFVPPFDLSFRRRYSRCPHKHQLKRLMINFDTWKDPYEGAERWSDTMPDIAGSTNLLEMVNGIDEVFIVVGDPADIARAARERDFIFVEPFRRPRDQLKGFSFDKKPDNLDLGMDVHNMQYCWYQLAERLEKILEHFKVSRAAMRRDWFGKQNILLCGRFPLG